MLAVGSSPKSSKNWGVPVSVPDAISIVKTPIRPACSARRRRRSVSASAAEARSSASARRTLAVVSFVMQETPAIDPSSSKAGV